MSSGFTANSELKRAFEAMPAVNTHGPVEKAQRRVWAVRKARRAWPEVIRIYADSYSTRLHHQQVRQSRLLVGADYYRGTRSLLNTNETNSSDLHSTVGLASAYGVQAIRRYS